MVKITKRMQVIRDNIDANKHYNINEAIILLKKFSKTKFIESIDVSINLGIDARKSDQNIRGAIVLPHGTGRLVRIAVFAQGINAEAAASAGADIIGMEGLAEQIKKGEINFDVIISSPDAMYIVSQLGKILGPRGLMPNPKFGTITNNVAEAVKNTKMGQIRYRNDKNGIIHTTIGKVNFEEKKIQENLETLLVSLKKVKPAHSKGLFFKKISISTTMGAGIVIDTSDLNVQLN